jgi:hypothetical protein
VSGEVEEEEVNGEVNGEVSGEEWRRGEEEERRICVSRAQMFPCFYFGK